MSSSPPTWKEASDEDFVAMLRMIADAHDESGAHATADVYREAARRIEVHAETMRALGVAGRALQGGS